MGFCRCLCLGSSTGTCLTTVRFFFLLLPAITLLIQQRQPPLPPAAARLPVEYPSPAVACLMSIETYFAPWSKPIESSKAARLPYIPLACATQHYLFHTGTAASAAASLSTPLLAVFALSEKVEASSFFSVHQRRLMSATPNSSSITGIVNDGAVNAEESHAPSPCLGRLAAIPLSHSPMLRPLWAVRSSCFSYFLSSANQEDREAAATAGGTPPANTLTAARTRAAATAGGGGGSTLPVGKSAAAAAGGTPTAAGGAQYAYRASLVGAGHRRLSKSDQAPAAKRRSTAEQQPLPSAVAGESPTTLQDAATDESKLLRVAGAAASRAYAGTEAATPASSVPTHVSTAASRSVATNTVASTAASSPAFAFSDSHPAAPSAAATPAFSGVLDVPPVYYASDEAGLPYKAGAVVLHGGGRGRTHEEQQKGGRSLLRWLALVQAAEAFEKLRTAALQEGNMFARWLLPPSGPPFLPYLAIQHSRGSARGRPEQTKGGSGGTEGGKTPRGGTMTYAVNGIAAAAEALEGLPTDDDEYVAAAADALFDCDGEHRKSQPEKKPVKEKKTRKRMKRESTLRMKTFLNLGAAAPDRNAPVHMSRLQWSGGKPFPVFGRSNIVDGWKTEEAAVSTRAGRKRAMKKNEKGGHQTLQELHRKRREDAGRKEQGSRTVLLERDTAAGPATATRNAANARAAGEKTMEEPVGDTAEENAAGAVAGTAARAVKERPRGRKLRKERGKQGEDSQATPVGRAAGETVTAANRRSKDGSDIGAVLPGTAAAAGGRILGEGQEAAGDIGDEAVAAGQPDTVGAVGDEAVAEVGEEAME